MAPQTRAGGKRNNKKFVGKNTKSSSPQPYGKAFSKPVVKPGLRVPKKNQTVLHEDYEYGDMVRQRSKDNLSKSNYSSVYDNSFRYAKKKKPKMQDLFPKKSNVTSSRLSRNAYIPPRSETRTSEESPRDVFNSIRQLPQIYGVANTKAVFSTRRADSRLAKIEEVESTPNITTQEAPDSYSYYKNFYQYETHSRPSQKRSVY